MKKALIFIHVRLLTNTLCLVSIHRVRTQFTEGALILIFYIFCIFYNFYTFQTTTIISLLCTHGILCVKSFNIFYSYSTFSVEMATFLQS